MKIDNLKGNEISRKRLISGLAGKIAFGFILFSVISGLIMGCIFTFFESQLLSNLSAADLTGIQNKFIVMIVCSSLMVVGISIPVGIYLAKVITKPISSLNDALKQLAVGEIDFNIDQHKSSKAAATDELDEMLASLTMLVENRDNMAEAVEALAKGDLTVVIEPSSDHDRIAHALIDIIEQLNLLYSEMSKTGAEIAFNGNFNFKGDPEILSGSYQDFIKGFNLVTGGLLETLKMAGQSIQDIGQGKIPARIDKEYPGDFNMIKDSINACIDGLGALVEGNEVLAHTIRNDFTKKIEGTYSGLYGTISESINTTVEQFMFIIKITNNISQGDLQDLDFLKNFGKQSENDVFVPSLVEMIETIQNLVEETQKMTQNAVVGDLSKRGDPSRFKGEYAKVIEGFNQTLNAVIAPINEASETLKALSEGNLQIEMTGDYRGDHAAVKDALNGTIRFLKQIVNEIAMILKAIQQGDLNHETTAFYKGDFFEIKVALNEITTQLSKTLSEINVAAGQVENGAQQISSGGQALSQGATEQASAIEELTASIEEVASETKKNAISANQARELTIGVQENAQIGNSQMKKMMSAMDEINTSSRNISKIIKVIDEIAFQTNILALNAAVEAARAGQHGKGFAVVAEEVRTLAARSAGAAKETTGLIEGSMTKVEQGTAIADETATSLEVILNRIEEVAGIVDEIARGSNEQASSIAEITQGIEQVSQVVQTNSATAEESAAASQELSGQAEMLKQMMGTFVMKDHHEIGLGLGKVDNVKPQREEVMAITPTIILDDVEADKY